MTKEEELGIGKDRRKVDINEEYYRLAAKVGFITFNLREAIMRRRRNDYKEKAYIREYRIWMIGRIRG